MGRVARPVYMVDTQGDFDGWTLWVKRLVLLALFVLLCHRSVEKMKIEKKASAQGRRGLGFGAWRLWGTFRVVSQLYMCDMIAK